MRGYSIEARTRNYVKEYGFLLFARKYKKQLLDTGLDAVKTTSKKVVHKVVEFLGNKIADAVTNSNNYKIVKPDENPRNVGKIVIPPKEKDNIFKKLKKVL